LGTERKPEVRTSLHQEADTSINLSLFSLRKHVPPLLELISEFDFPYHIDIMALIQYGIDAMIGELGELRPN
jgi:hypothetical protein